MAIQRSVAVRNAQLEALETTIGAAPILEIRSGSQPANCAAADSGTLLASMTLPSDWLAAASGGSKAKLGTWEDTSANADGTAAHYRIKDSGGTTCHEQGSVSASGGGGDLQLLTTAILTGQPITITAWTYTAPHA